MKLASVAILIVACLNLSCMDAWLGAPAPQQSPIANFEALWEDFDRHYGMFETKNMDWDAQYRAFRPQVTEQTTQEELFHLLVRMLEPLRDPHITLYPTSTNLPNWSYDLDEEGYSVQNSVDINQVLNHYLTARYETGGAMDHGLLAANIGYIHIRHFDFTRKVAEKQLDKIFSDLSGVKGIVLDLRDTPGGYDPAAQYVAGRFAVKEVPYMVVKKRNSPDRQGFTEPVIWKLRPEGDQQFTKPVVFLTSRTTQSAGETFALAMQQLPHVIQMGDTTSGAFSDAIMRELPNGWLFMLSIGDYRTPEGVSLEGVGVAPKILVNNSLEDLKVGKDRMLETAIGWLEANAQ